jgi:hypothetical protein
MQIYAILLCSCRMVSQRVAVLVRLSPELKRKLVELAERERRSLSKQVEILLENCLSEINGTVDESPQIGRKHQGRPGRR